MLLTEAGLELSLKKVFLEYLFSSQCWLHLDAIVEEYGKPVYGSYIMAEFKKRDK